jgi:hypothetical protein
MDRIQANGAGASSLAELFWVAITPAHFDYSRTANFRLIYHRSKSAIRDAKRRTGYSVQRRNGLFIRRQPLQLRYHSHHVLHRLQSPSIHSAPRNFCTRPTAAAHYFRRGSSTALGSTSSVPCQHFRRERSNAALLWDQTVTHRLCS